MRWSIPYVSLLAVLALLPSPTRSCSYCSSVQQAPTFRMEANLDSARMIVYGTVHDRGNNGSELHVTSFLKVDPTVGEKKVVPMSRFIPVTDAKNPPRFVLFCDVDKDKIDTYRGVPIKSDDGLEYIKKALALDPKDRGKNLLFYFKYLENPDPEVSRDAFLEFAKAGDLDIGQIASKLSPEKLRGWLKDTKTGPERIGLYAFLLGGCGADDDAAYLLGLLKKPDERTLNAYDGVLGGYVHLKQKEGWDFVASLLKDGHTPIQQRLAAVRVLQFYHGWQPKENREHVVMGLKTMLDQGELADVAIEDLRRWEMWDLTRDVLSVYGKKGYDGPIMKQAIVRYALCCKDDKSVAPFVQARRRDEAELVKDVEESLKFDK